ncbi:MAG: gliding motility-associated C-terminal domain-containing protein [Flavobacteriales bacterium]|nr:gliding motility-associated C-terminal domain-containing protein [Flavobacteriales bacterium]MDG2246874.1 gliding motility-associated C-terminal domain-containing protein [Flavobacteriales bacterium]
MKRILLALTLLISSQAIVAQVTDILVVVDTVHCGIVGETDMSGYITYDVFACFQNEDDFLSAIYGELLDQDDPLVFEADEADIVVTDPDGCGCFNDPLFGSFLGNNVFPITPEAEYDTYWTIGMESSFDAGSLDFISSVPLTGTVGDDPCSAMIDDGVIFSLNGSPNGVAGPDLKVQIGQFTTCSESLSLQFCLQTFPLGDGGNLVEECFDNIQLANPCLDNTLEISQPLLCFGDAAQLSCEGLGNGEITFELFETDGTDTTLVSTQIDDPVFDNVTEGDYYLSIMDSFGCKDTTNLISIVEPDELLVTLAMPEDNLCFGDVIADICPTITGGTVPYTIEAVGPDSEVEEIELDECFENLGCIDGQGNYDIIITDDNGCVAEADTVVFCPADLVITTEQTVIDCFGDDDGELEINITGGTGELTIDLDTPGFVQIVQEGPVDIEVLDIVPGTYTLTVVDENNCSTSEEYVFEEPAEIIVDYTSTDIQCFGECSGTVEFIASGGTGDLVFTITDLEGGAADQSALCAGDYEVIITDANNCQAIDTVNIVEPLQIQFTAATTDVTCFGAGDGTICISDVIGGVGVVQWQIVSPPTQATDLGTLPCFEMLPAETYVVNLVDEVGCTIPINGLEIVEPDEILIDFEATNVSCNGFGDGEIVVTTIGGTGEVTITSPASLVDLIPGDYNIIVMDESGCQDSVLTSITEPETLTIEVLSTTVIGCGGDCDGTADIDLNGGSGELVLFLNDVASVPFGLCSGDYEAIVLDENLCTDTAQFEIVQPDPIEFIIDIANVTCTGMNDGEVTIIPIGGTGPLNFEILEDVDIFNLFEGEYTVLAEDSTGCFADSTFTIGADITTDLDVSLFTSPVTCWEEADGTATAAVTGGELPISYQWNDENAQTTATAVGLPEEVYSVTVTDAIGCTLSFLVEVEPTVGCFFIADALTPNGDGANDEWVIGGLEYFPNSTVQVFNRWGQLLFESTGYATRWDGRFKSNLLPIADYYYVITYDEAKDPITGTVTIKY